MELSTQWTTHFPRLAAADDANIKRIMGRAKTLTFPANKQVSSPGMACEYCILFSNVGQRLADVIARIEQLCSPAIDRHLAETLLRLSTSESGPVCITHQELASELGTAREVVSRHLKQFELRNWVHLGRGTIQLKDRNVLSDLSKK